METEIFSRSVEKRISRLRWTAGLLWLAWSFAAVAVYSVHRFAPPSMEKTQFLVLGSTVLGLGGLWFAYMIWRIGRIADGVDR